MFGATISGAIAIAVALVDGGWQEALWMLLIVIVVQQIEGSLLYPFLFGKAASIHPMVILLSVSIGTLLAGFVGAVISVPLVSFVTTFVTKMNNPDAIAPGEEEEDEEPATEPAPA
jgi:predicted PurR-regulated permease PerM